MELRPGYRKTEIGVIPEDWELVTLGQIAQLERGKFSARPRNDRKFFGGNIPFIQTGEVSRVEESNFAPQQFLNTLGLQQSRLFQAGTLFFTIAANIADVGIAPFATACPDSIIGIIEKPGVEKRWLYYDLSSRKKSFESLATPGAQLNLNLERLRPYKLALPSLCEQKGIAEALSDVDAAIGALSRLITKKRDLRQGVMQRLLTGRTRLPGFTAPWQLKRLADHVTFLKNGIQSRAQLTLDDPVRYLHYGDIHVAADLRLDLRNAIMPRLPAPAAARLTRLANGDLVFVDASEDLVGVGKSLEIIGAQGIEAVAGQHTIAARFDKSVLADGFKCYLQFIPAFATHLRRLAAGTKVYATNRKHIASAELQLPQPDEQTAIAQVLSDMEAEIAVLSARLAKTHALKQAMMQALLTGRVRLPLPREEAPMSKEAAYA